MSCNEKEFKKTANEVFSKGVKYNNWDMKQNSVGARRKPVGKRGSKSVGKR